MTREIPFMFIYNQVPIVGRPDTLDSKIAIVSGQLGVSQHVLHLRSKVSSGLTPLDPGICNNLRIEWYVECQHATTRAHRAQ